MLENLIIGGIFLLAIGYLLNIVRKNFSTKNDAGCAKGCGSCQPEKLPEPRFSGVKDYQDKVKEKGEH